MEGCLSLASPTRLHVPEDARACLPEGYTSESLSAWLAFKPVASLRSFRTLSLSHSSLSPFPSNIFSFFDLYTYIFIVRSCEVFLLDVLQEFSLLALTPRTFNMFRHTFTFYFTFPSLAPPSSFPSTCLTFFLSTIIRPPLPEHTCRLAC